MSTQSEKSESFLRHLEPLQAALESYCRRWLSDGNLVEDVLQSAILKAYRDFHLFAEGTNFRAWIYRYLNLEVLATNRVGAAKAMTTLQEEPLATDDWQLEFDADSFDSLLASPEGVLQQCDAPLARAVQQLRPLDRSVLLLKAIGGFKYREIAEIISVPMGTVMSSLSRARHRVRHELVEYAREHGLLKNHTYENNQLDQPRP